MNSKSFTFIVYILLISLSGFSQKNETLLTIHNQKISENEFLRLYKKNNIPGSLTEFKSIDEYLQMFINFKLKVTEAINSGFDTTIAFKAEFNEYKKQLASTYFIDKQQEDFLVTEAYNRLKTEIRTFHILVNVSWDASAFDTLLAYNKALTIRKRLLAGEKFSDVARETSDDPAAARTGGDLWYLTAMRTPYEFENYIYNAKPNEISMPVRTRFGYHIIKTTEKRPAQGQIKVAHIMVALSPQDTGLAVQNIALTKIKDIETKLKNGADFSQLAIQLSDDKSTTQKAGELPWFGTGQMVEDFETAAFSLKKDNDISAPVKTFLGYHIIKRLEKKELPSFDEIKTDLRNKVLNDPRAELCRSRVIERLKIEYKYQQISSLNDYYRIIDSTIFEGIWSKERASRLTGNLFILAGKNYNQADFTNYLYKKQMITEPIPVEIYINRMYNNFVEETIINYETENLSNKYEDFKYLLQEYYDGILLFNLSDKKIWSKAIEDTIELRKFYKQNIQKYQDTAKINISVFYYSDENFRKAGLKALSKKNIETTDSMIIAQTDPFKTGLFGLEKTGVFKRGDYPIADKIMIMIEKDEITKKENLIDLIQDKKIVFINQRISAQTIPLEQIKGLVIADYQNFLEKEWEKELKQKYKITINQQVLEKIKEENK